MVMDASASGQAVSEASLDQDDHDGEKAGSTLQLRQLAAPVGDRVPASSSTVSARNVRTFGILLYCCWSCVPIVTWTKRMGKIEDRPWLLPLPPPLLGTHAHPPPHCQSRSTQ